MRYNLKKEFTLCVAVFLFFSLSCKKDEVSVVSSKVIFLAGKVLIAGQDIKIGQPIKSGDEILTGEKSFCEIIFNKQNIIRIDENTRVILDFDKNAARLNSGALMSVMKKFQKRKIGPFVITTPTTSATIRGTTFYVKVENPESTYFCDCNGVVEVGDALRVSLKELKANHHRGVRVIEKSGVSDIVDAGMLYHTDFDMENIAEKIGLKIDWTRIDYEEKLIL